MDNNNNIQEQPVQQRRTSELLQRQRQRMEVLKESVATKAIEEEEDKDAVLSASNNSRLVESLKNEINVQKEKITMDRNEDRLLLITCYPFDSILSGTPFRYIVYAKKNNT